MRLPKPSHRFFKSAPIVTLFSLLAIFFLGGSKTLAAGTPTKYSCEGPWKPTIESTCIIASDGCPTCEYKVVNMPAGLLVSNIKSGILLNEYDDKNDIWVKPDGMSNSVLYHFTKTNTDQFARVEAAIEQYDVSPESHRILVEIWVAVVTATKDSDFSLNITGLLNNLLSGTKVSLAPGPAAISLGLSFSDQTFNNIRAFYKRSFSVQEAIHAGLSDDNQGYQGIYNVQNIAQAGTLQFPISKPEGLYTFYYDKALYNKKNDTIRVSNFNLGFGLPVIDFSDSPNVEKLEIKNEMVTFYNGIPTNISRKGFTRDQHGSSLGLQMGTNSDMVDGEIHVWARFTAFPHTKDFANLSLETISHPPKVIAEEVKNDKHLPMSDVLSKLTLAGIVSTERLLWNTNYLFLPEEVARRQNINSFIIFNFKHGDGFKLLEEKPQPKHGTVLDLINQGIQLPINNKAKSRKGEPNLSYFSVEAVTKEIEIDGKEKEVRKIICYAFDPIYNRKISSKTIENVGDCGASTFADELGFGDPKKPKEQWKPKGWNLFRKTKEATQRSSDSSPEGGSGQADKAYNDAGI